MRYWAAVAASEAVGSALGSSAGGSNCFALSDLTLAFHNSTVGKGTAEEKRMGAAPAFAFAVVVVSAADPIVAVAVED